MLTNDNPCFIRVWFQPEMEDKDEEKPEVLSPSSGGASIPLVFVDDFQPDGDEEDEEDGGRDRRRESGIQEGSGPPGLQNNPTISRKLTSFQSFLVGRESSRTGVWEGWDASNAQQLLQQQHNYYFYFYYFVMSVGYLCVFVSCSPPPPSALV